jgi:hypothetical protein
MGCQCSNIPQNIKIIKVGDSEVGIFGLRKILRKIYLLNIEDEEALKRELLSRIKEKNHVSEERRGLYEEALLREYRAYAQTQRPIQKNDGSQENRHTESISFFKRIFRAKKTGNRI